ncbi:hypothetical protein A2U01_0055592, partial [Trifolium medium]|nr:hypothetical protein [Trifolium medium]
MILPSLRSFQEFCEGSGFPSWSRLAAIVRFHVVMMFRMFLPESVGL